MGAQLHQAAGVKAQHMVRMFDGGQRGAMTKVVRSGMSCASHLHQAFGFVVERGSGFVEDQDRRVLEHRAGDRQALALAAGQLAAACADRSIRAVRQSRHEVHGVGLAHGGVDALRRRALEFAVSHVVGHAAVEQHDLLSDDGDLAAQVGQRVIGQGMPIQQHLSPLRLVETREQLDQGGLAAAGAPHDGGDRARPRGEADAPQSRRFLALVTGIESRNSKRPRARASGTALIAPLGAPSRKQPVRRLSALEHALHVGDLARDGTS